MREIRGDAKNIRSLLSGSNYSIDHSQREYRWERKQVAERVWSPNTLLIEIDAPP